MDIANLFLELSNPDRLRILKLLNKEKMRLSSISNELGLSVQETYRHLLRLTRSRLISKDNRGHYFLTTFGQYILAPLTSIHFLYKYREYFLTHNLTRIPLKFLERMGELANSRYAPDTFTAIFFIEKIIEEAEKYILIISEQILFGVVKILSKKAETIPVKILLPLYLFIPQEIQINRYMVKNLDIKFLEKIDIALIQNEKHAGIAFPRLDGEIDYRGFLIEDPLGLSWCKDIFEYYWKDALV